MKDKGIKILTSILLLIIILAGVGIYIFFEFDMFKTNKELFYKYFVTQNIKSARNFELVNFEKLNIKEKKYQFNGEIKLDAFNKSLELEEELGIKLNAKKDSKLDKLSSTTILNLGEKELLNVKFQKESDKIALKADEITEEKYIIVEKENFNELAEKLGLGDYVENISTFLTKYNFENKNISIGRLREIENKYKKLLNEIISDDKFSIEKVETEIDEKKQKANKITLTLTEKEVFDIIYKFLEALNSDVETQQFYIEYFNEDITIKEINDTLETLMKEFDTSEKEYSEEYQLKISVYVCNGKNIKTEISNTMGNDISLYLNSTGNKNRIKLEIFTPKNEEENIFADTVTSFEIKNVVKSKKCELHLYLNKEYNQEDIADLEENTLENLNIECDFLIKKENIKNMNVTGKLDYNENNILNLTGKISLENNDYEFEDFNDENSIILNTYTEEELNTKLTNMESTSINKVLSISEEIIPGSSIIVSTILSGLGIGNVAGYVTNIQDYVGNDVKSEINQALANCIDQYAYAYILDNTVTLDEYLTEEKVKNFCSNAKQIIFTDAGIRYITNEGKIYEGEVDTSLENGYIYVKEMNEVTQ